MNYYMRDGQPANYNYFLLFWFNFFFSVALYLRHLQQKLERNKCPIQKQMVTQQ